MVDAEKKKRKGNTTQASSTATRRVATTTNANTKADEIISTALSFAGTRYKYGGTTRTVHPFSSGTSKLISSTRK